MLLVTGGGFRWRSQGEDYEQLPRYLVARALHRLHAEMREVCASLSGNCMVTFCLPNG